MKNVDSSGRCWGVASSIRGLPSYGTTCDNLDMALTIVQHPEASVAERALAGGYFAVEAVAHGAFLVGAAGLACGLIGGCAAAVGPAVGLGGRAATGAATAACADGDCTNEARAAAQVATRALEANRALGRAGEEAARIIRNTERIDSLTGTARFRVPDQLLRAERLLTEVKNVSYQSFTSQLRDYLAYAQRVQCRFELVVRADTRISAPLQRTIAAGLIILRRGLGVE